MDKTAIKNFAVAARIMLIQAVTQMAFEFDVTENGKNDPAQESVNGRSLTQEEKNQRSQLIARININGFSQTMEEAAYTWFNRFIALRFMEVNNYLPSHTRIFSDGNGDFKPEVLSAAVDLDIPGLDKELILELFENQENERLYKYIIITQCNALNAGLPEMFEEIGGWTELLFPKNLLREDSVIAKMVQEIPEDDWKDQVQIIGWLYQYYNTEPKEKVFADLKRNIKVTAASIPAATQLFTPDWIVRYMVENSLGRLWTEGHGKPENADWKYYLEEAQQEETVQKELAEIRNHYKNMQPEDIKIIDPCMGSGHILVYAFDVLMDIYTACGWSERDAAKSILCHNLYGLDIDRRAYQLAYFAVMMKARQYNRRILSPENQPKLANFADVMGVDSSMLTGVAGEFAQQFANADTYGSLMTVTAPEGLDEAVSDFIPTFGLNRRQLEMMMKIYSILSQQYDVVCTNPPYMGGSNMNAVLSDFVKKNFPDSKSDLFACFIERGIQLTNSTGYNCMVTMQSWMFLSSFEKMRVKIINGNTISSLMHMENMVMGIAFGTAVSIIRKCYIKGFKGTYNHIKLENIVDSVPVEFPVTGNRFAQVSSENFAKIPGAPVAYWVSENFVRAFEDKKLGDYGKTCQGLATGNNDKFLRLWHECDFTTIFWSCKTHEESYRELFRWYPCTKGGSFRRWYGNLEYVVNWYKDGCEIKKYRGSVIRNINFYFKKAYTWSTISSGKFSMRYAPIGSIFESKGSKCFVDDKNFNYILGLLNTCVAQEMLTFLAPTLDYHEGPVSRIPIKFPYLISDFEKIHHIVEENIDISKQDWDSFETSWDFKKHPLV